MPENSIKAKLKFYFDNNKIELETLINLDFVLSNKVSLSNYYVLKQIAKVNVIDLKSELFTEILKQKIKFFDAKGDAIPFLEGDKFNFWKFKCQQEEHEICTEILSIIRCNLKIQALDDIKGLEQTLLDICDVFQKKYCETNPKLENR